MENNTEFRWKICCKQWKTMLNSAKKFPCPKQIIVVMGYFSSDWLAGMPTVNLVLVPNPGNEVSKVMRTRLIRDNDAKTRWRMNNGRKSTTRYFRYQGIWRRYFQGYSLKISRWVLYSLQGRHDNFEANSWFLLGSDLSASKLIKIIFVELALSCCFHRCEWLSEYSVV